MVLEVGTKQRPRLVCNAVCVQVSVYVCGVVGVCGVIVMGAV